MHPSASFLLPWIRAKYIRTRGSRKYPWQKRGPCESVLLLGDLDPIPHAMPYRDPSTFSEVVWGGFGGSRCLLRRYLDR